MDTNATRSAFAPPPDFHCQQCGITMSAANTGTHLAGKKHRKRCDEIATADGGVLIDFDVPSPTLPGPVAPVDRARRRGYSQYSSIGEAYQAEARKTAGQGGQWRREVPLASGEMWTSLFKRGPGFTRVANRETAPPGENHRSPGNTREIVYEDTAMTKEEEPGLFQVSPGLEEVNLETQRPAPSLGPHRSPRPPSPPPPSAFTLQSESSTARLYCDACVRQLITPTGFVAHMKGKTHRLNLDAKLAAQNTPSEADVDLEDHAINDDPSRWFCTSCKTDFRPDQREEHLGSLLHALGLGEFPTFDDEPPAVAARAASEERQPAVLQPDVAIDAFHCVPCGLTGKLANYNRHRNNDTHRKEMIRVGPVGDSPARASHSRPGTWYCANCMVDLHVDSRETHLAKYHSPEAVMAAHMIRISQGPIGDSASTISSDQTTDVDAGSVRLPVLVKDEPVVGINAAARKASSDVPWRSRRRTIASALAKEDKKDVLPGEKNLNSAAGTLEDTAKAAAEPERWFCSLCNADMPTTMQAAHELHPSHQRIKHQQDSGQTARSRPTGASDGPTTSQEPQSGAESPSLRCDICLTTYDSSETHLHTSPPWDCERCNMILHIESKAEHLSSVSHRLKEPVPNTVKRAFTPAGKATFFCLPCRGNFPVHDRKFHISPPYYCALCDLVMHTDTRDIHEWSRPHSLAVAEATGVLSVKSEERFDCRTCGESFLLGVLPFHRSRAWTCAVCEMTVHMDWIGAHLMSAEHVAREVVAVE